MIRPSTNARLEHPDLSVRNVAIQGVGHLSLPNNSSVAFTIASALTELDLFETSETPGPA